MLWVVRIFGCFLISVTVLPLLTTGKWYVRWWDFPRLQVALLLNIPLLLSLWLILRTNPELDQGEPMIWAGLSVVALSLAGFAHR